MHRRNLIGWAAGALLSPAWGADAAGKRNVQPVPGIANIRDFGTKGDGVTIDSAAIDKAIDYVAARGGGTVLFPAGTYASYTIHLKSNVTLYLERGAILLAAPTPLTGAERGCYDAAEPQDPAIEPFQDFAHNHWRNSLIHGEGLHNIAITGPGRIWGKGLSCNNPKFKDLPKAELPGVGCRAIALKNCVNVTLSGFSLLEGGWLAVLATGVDNLVIDGLLVDTNRDGFDIDCCRNVRISNCTINAPLDDGICPKSSFALGYARATENVTISDCWLSGNYEVGSVMDGTFKRGAPGKLFRNGRLKFGTESNGGFKNVTITNCVFDECRGISLLSVDGAAIEDITLSNLSMRGMTNAPLFLRLGRRMRGPAGMPIGSLRRVMIDNVTSSGASIMPSIIAGVADHPVEDVHISNVYFEQTGGAGSDMAAILPPSNDDKYPEPSFFGDLPASGFYIRRARNIDVSHAEIATLVPDARPAFWMRDVEGFDGSFLKVPPGPAFQLSNVSQFRTFGCRDITDKHFQSAVTAQF